MLPRKGFIFKPTERAYVPLKYGKIKAFTRWGNFSVTITGDCERFQDFETTSLKNKDAF